ncbi:MAG: hypothetical protein Q7U04_06960 [Bacteriovorax sp.]|nr:hypothetical protein [Bacteriovorax sp.]
MSLMNRLFAFLIITTSFSVNADVNIKTIILQDDSIVESKDISAINIDKDSDAIHSVELNDESVINSSDIKLIILKNASRFNRIHETAASSSGNGSGG